MRAVAAWRLLVRGSGPPALTKVNPALTNADFDPHQSAPKAGRRASNPNSDWVWPMELRDLILYLEAGAPPEARLRLTAALAQAQGASVTALLAPAELRIPIPDGYAIGAAAVGDVLSRRQAELAKTLAPIEAAFRAAMTAAGVAHHVAYAALEEAQPDLIQRARFHDLAILRRPVSHDHPSQRLAELLAVSSGVPCLLTPDDLAPGAGFARVLVAWNGGREAKRALQDALPFLKAAQAVRLAAIDGEASETAIGAARDDILRHLALHGVAAELERVDALGGDAGAALLRQCGRFHADLLVMGAYGHSRTKEMILGGATRTVLAQAPLPVLMSH